MSCATVMICCGMSLSLGSTPNLPAARISTRSVKRLSIAASRVAGLRKTRSIFIRSSISMFVIGSPLMLATISWAKAGRPAGAMKAAITATATRRLKRTLATRTPRRPSASFPVSMIPLLFRALVCRLAPDLMQGEGRLARHEKSVFHAVERRRIEEGPAHLGIPQRAQLQLQQYGLVTDQGAATVVLINRAVVDGKGRALVLIAAAHPKGRDRERARIRVANQTGGIEMAAHVEDNVALGEIIIADLVARGEAKTFAAYIVTDEGLRLIIGELNRTGQGTQIIRSDKIDAPRLQCIDVEPSLADEREDGIRRDCNGAYIIGASCVQSRT